MTTDAGFTPTDEDVQRAAEALYDVPTPDLELTRHQMMRAVTGPSFAKQARVALATIGLIIERERRAAKVEALRELALTNVTHSGVTLTPDVVSRWLRERADEIERE